MIIESSPYLLRAIQDERVIMTAPSETIMHQNGVQVVGQLAVVTKCTLDLLFQVYSPILLRFFFLFEFI